MRSRRSCTLLLFALAACGGDGPKTYPLKTVMIEVEVRRVRLERALLRTDGLETAHAEALKIRRWVDDPAADHYLERSDIRGTRADFERLKAEFDPKLDALIEATGAGDLAESRRLFPELEASCNACHVVFRPDLAAR